MANNDLTKYINSARESGVSDDEIKSQLIQAGWGEREVVTALTPKPTSGIPVPPPPVPHFGMWVTFEYIILFISLYVSATALGGILYKVVDKIIPDSLDKLNTYGYYYGSYANTVDQTLMRTYIASLIVAFPIFAILFLVLKKQSLEKPAVRNLKARKLLIYMTMIITFVIMLAHTIRIIYGLLGGDITGRSVGHLAITFLIAGSIFGYFLYDVKGDRKT